MQIKCVNASSLCFCKMHHHAFPVILKYFVFMLHVEQSLSFFFTPKARVLFVDVPYTLATEEAERIGVDHVARMSSAGNSEISSGNISFLKLISICYFCKFGYKVCC